MRRRHQHERYLLGIVLLALPNCLLVEAWCNPSAPRARLLPQSQFGVSRNSYRGRDPYEDYFYDDEGEGDDARRPKERSRRTDYDYLYDEEDDSGYYGDDDRYNNNNQDDVSYVAAPPGVEWEEVRVPSVNGSGETKAFVILPPSPASMHPLPSAVLHFVGGTFFGSLPQSFYKALLEDVVKNTQCAIVVTPLPLITPLTGLRGGDNTKPLDHVRMAETLKHQFRYAFELVLEDEYGQEAMQSVPIAGLGHSLGARILVVLATLLEDNNNSAAAPPPRRRRDKGPIYKYKSMILVGFTNFGAAESIPGIKFLLRGRREVEDKQRQRQRQRNQRPAADRGSPKRRSRRRQRDPWFDNDDDDEEEEDWAEIWADVQEAFQERALDVQTILTPKAKELEFYPSPRQLVSVLEMGKYRIPQTLMVQFDRDAVDQSALLASILAKPPEPSEGATSNATATNNNDKPMTDLTFARLRGKHLAPVTLKTSSSSPGSRRFEQENEGFFGEWSSKTMGLVEDGLKQYFEGKNVPKSNVNREEALRDLRQTITRYITDVVTK